MQKKSFFGIFILFISLSTYAQPGTIDYTFNSTDKGIGYGEINGTLSAFAIQSDGEIIIAGVSSIGGEKRNGIARLNADGSLDYSFNPQSGVKGYITSFALQKDRKIIVGGRFIHYNGDIYYLARLNADGNLDESFDTRWIIGSGHISAIAIENDGNIIIGGDFTSGNGSGKIAVARVNADGRGVYYFESKKIGAYKDIYSITIQNNGKIIIGGQSEPYIGTKETNITRLNADGSFDSSFKPGTGPNDYVNSTTIQNDGKIILCGNFTSYNGTNRNRIARLNSDGSLDTSFDPGTGANSVIKKIVVQSSGKIVINGDFTSYNGTFRKGIARLNANGSFDSTFNLVTETNGVIFHIALQSDGKIVICNGLTTYNGNETGILSRFDANGSIDNSFNNTGTGANYEVLCTAIQNDGKIIIGGSFTFFNGTVQNSIARLNVDGTLDNSFNSKEGPNGYVYSIGIQKDGKIIIRGNFSLFNGIDRNRIARLNIDGSLDDSFNPGVSSGIYSIAVQNDSKILIAGSAIYNGKKVFPIYRLLADGTLDTTFNSVTGPNGYISSMAIQSDGKIIIGGDFSIYNKLERKSILRLNIDGSLDDSFISGVSGNINSIAIQNDEKIIVGGQINSTYGKNLYRLYPNGNIDSQFSLGKGANGVIYSIAIQNDGKIIIGGEFSSYNDWERNKIARLMTNGNVDRSFNPGTGANNYIRTLSLQSDGKIIIGGNFTTYYGTRKNKITRIHGQEFTGIKNDNIFSNSIIYPNPASNELFIDTKKENCATTCEIFNQVGQVVYNISFIRITTINVERFKPGIYLVKIRTGKELELKKLVIQ
jgi:uncharacterized delta-60 repeat protein